MFSTFSSRTERRALSRRATIADRRADGLRPTARSRRSRPAPPRDSRGRPAGRPGAAARTPTGTSRSRSRAWSPTGRGSSTSRSVAAVARAAVHARAHAHLARVDPRRVERHGSATARRRAWRSAPRGTRASAARRGTRSSRRGRRAPSRLFIASALAGSSTCFRCSISWRARLDRAGGRVEILARRRPQLGKLHQAGLPAPSRAGAPRGPPTRSSAWSRSRASSSEPAARTSATARPPGSKSSFRRARRLENSSIRIASVRRHEERGRVGAPLGVHPLEQPHEGARRRRGASAESFAQSSAARSPRAEKSDAEDARRPPPGRSAR